METNPYETVLMGRIRELIGYRAWYRQHNGWLVQDRVEHMAELHYLIGLARKARKIAAGAPDPVTEAKAVDYHDWQAAYVEAAS